MTLDNCLAVIRNGTSKFWGQQLVCHSLMRLACIRVSEPTLEALMNQTEIGKTLLAELPAMKHLATLPDEILADTPTGEALREAHGMVAIFRSGASDFADKPNKKMGYALAAGPQDMVIFVHDSAGQANIKVPWDVLPRIAFNELLLQLMQNYPTLESIHFNDFKRLTRDEAGAEQVFAGAQLFDVDLHVGTAVVDLHSASGRVMARIETSAAADERKTGRGRTTVGVLNALHSGGDGAPRAWPRQISTMPLGYGPVKDAEGRMLTRVGKGHRWKLIAPDETEVDAVRNMLLLVAEGRSWREAGAPLVEAAVPRRGLRVPPGKTFATISPEDLSGFVRDAVTDPIKRHLWLTGHYLDQIAMPSANDGTFEGYAVRREHGTFGFVDVDVDFGLPPGGFVDDVTMKAIEERLARRTLKIPTDPTTCALFTHVPPYPLIGADGTLTGERRLSRVGLSYSVRERTAAESFDHGGRRRGWHSGEGALVTTVRRDVLERAVADAVARAVHGLDDQKLGIDLGAVRLNEHDAKRLAEADRLEQSAKDADQNGMRSDTLALQAANPESPDRAGMSRHMAAASKFFREAELHRERASALRQEVELGRDTARESVQADLSTVAAVAGGLRGYAGKNVPIEVNQVLMKVGLDTLRLCPSATNETTVDWSLRLELPLVGGETAHVPVSGVVRSERRDNKGDKTRKIQDAMAEQFLRYGRSIEEVMIMFGADRPYVIAGLRRFADRNGVRGRGKRSAIADIPAEMTEARLLLWEHLSGTSGTSKHLSRLEPLIVPGFMDGQSYPNSFVMHDTTIIRTVLHAMLEAGPDAMRDGVSLTDLARSVGASRTEMYALASPFNKDPSAGQWRVLARDEVNPDIVRLRTCPHADCVAPSGSRWLSYYLPVPFTTAYAGLACPSCRRVPDLAHARAYLPDSFFDWWNGVEETHRTNLLTEPATHRTHPDDYRPSASLPRGGRLFNLNEGALKLGITYDALYKWATGTDPDRPVVQRVSSRGKGGMKYVLTVEELERLEGLERLAELRMIAASHDAPDDDVVSLGELSRHIGVHESYLRDLALAGGLGPIDRRPSPAGPLAIMLPRDAVLNATDPSQGTELLPKDWITRHRMDLLLIGEAVTRTGKSAYSIRRACDQGELFCVTTDGGTRRFETQELDRWIAETGSTDLNTKQASEYTGVHGDTLRAAVRDGELQARLTKGGHRRFDPAELDRWATARRSSSRGLHASSA
jgi:excisionase family DNA binding protein